jgi:hypothetical protein
LDRIRRHRKLIIIPNGRRPDAGRMTGRYSRVSAMGAAEWTELGAGRKGNRVIDLDASRYHGHWSSMRQNDVETAIDVYVCLGSAVHSRKSSVPSFESSVFVFCVYSLCEVAVHSLIRAILHCELYHVNKDELKLSIN